MIWSVQILACREHRNLTISGVNVIYGSWYELPPVMFDIWTRERESLTATSEKLLPICFIYCSLLIRERRDQRFDNRFFRFGVWGIFANRGVWACTSSSKYIFSCNTHFHIYATAADWGGQNTVDYSKQRIRIWSSFIETTDTKPLIYP